MIGSMHIFIVSKVMIKAKTKSCIFIIGNVIKRFYEKAIFDFDIISIRF